MQYRGIWRRRRFWDYFFLWVIECEWDDMRGKMCMNLKRIIQCWRWLTLVLTWIEKYEKKEHQFGTFYFWNIHISIQQIDSTDFVFQFSYLITFPLLWALGIRCAISTVKCLWASHKSCFFSLLQSTQMRDSRSNTHTLPQSISINFLQFLYFLLIYKGIVSQIHWTINT